MGFLNLCRENLLGPGNSDTVQYIPYKTFVSLSAHSVSDHLRIALNRKRLPLSWVSCSLWRAWPFFSSFFSWLVNCWPTRSAKSTTGWVIILYTVQYTANGEIYSIEVLWTFKLLLVFFVLLIWQGFSNDVNATTRTQWGLLSLFRKWVSQNSLAANSPRIFPGILHPDPY